MSKIAAPSYPVNHLQESGWLDDFRSMWKIGDCLKSERENNLTWASWANETIYDLLIDIEILNFKVLARLGVCPVRICACVCLCVSGKEGESD